MFVLGIQKIGRPIVNLLVAHFSPSKCDAAKAVAVMTAINPLGRIVYGWLNEIRPLSPAFQTVGQYAPYMCVTLKVASIGIPSHKSTCGFELIDALESWGQGLSLYICCTKAAF